MADVYVFREIGIPEKDNIGRVARNCSAPNSARIESWIGVVEARTRGGLAHIGVTSPTGPIGKHRKNIPEQRIAINMNED